MNKLIIKLIINHVIEKINYEIKVITNNLIRNKDLILDAR